MTNLPGDLKKLIEIYQTAQRALIKTIAEMEAKGNVTSYKKSLLNQVNEQIYSLDNKARQWVKEVISNSYKGGTADAITALKNYYQDIESNSFNGLNTDAINALVKNAYGDLHDANNYLAKRIFSVVDQIIFDATAQKLAQGLTLKEFRKNLINSFIAEGLNGFEDKRGRKISLEAYATTVAKSSVRNATNRGMIDQLISIGHDLVKMSSHNTSCPVCAVYQGRVYSITGKDKRYPKLEVAFSGPYANIHPNCSHFITPYVEALANDPEGDRLFSNSDFDIDPRSQKEIDNYNNRQREKARLRNDKEQWQKYSLALPAECPKNFTVFQKMKNDNSKAWQRLQENFKHITNKGGKNV